MSKNVKQTTVVFDKQEVSEFWHDFIDGLQEYAKRHFVRNGKMTEEECMEKVSVSLPFLDIQIDPGLLLKGVEVDVEISQD